MQKTFWFLQKVHGRKQIVYLLLGDLPAVGHGNLFAVLLGHRLAVAAVSRSCTSRTYRLRNTRYKLASLSPGQVLIGYKVILKFSLLLQSALLLMGAQFGLFPMLEIEKVICFHNSPLNTQGEAIDLDHRIMKQQYTTLFPFKGIWVVERPVVWHANKNINFKVKYAHKYKTPLPSYGTGTVERLGSVIDETIGLMLVLKLFQICLYVAKQGTLT